MRPHCGSPSRNTSIRIRTPSASDGPSDRINSPPPSGAALQADPLPTPLTVHPQWAGLQACPLPTRLTVRAPVGQVSRPALRQPTKPLDLIPALGASPGTTISKQDQLSPVGQVSRPARHPPNPTSHKPKTIHSQSHSAHGSRPTSPRHHKTHHVHSKKVIPTQSTT